jgi:hypothetical protein
LGAPCRRKSIFAALAPAVLLINGEPSATKDQSQLRLSMTVLPRLRRSFE